MTEVELQEWINGNPLLALGAAVLFSIVAFLIARGIIARGLMSLAKRTETKYDDIVVRHLHPFRVAWLAPLLVLFVFSGLAPEFQRSIEKITLLLILWITALTIGNLLNALNQIYESSPGFTGVSIQGYFDVVKILVIVIAIILSISMITEQPPGGLLAGVGAITAILLLIFRDTILSFVASIQISTNDLIREGDWLEVPSYGADGDVVDMNLHNVKIMNFDKTFTVIPTYKMIEVAYKNWRGMQESGGRRIKRALHIDLHSIKFCDEAMLERFKEIELLRNHVSNEGSDEEATGVDNPSPALNETTNVTFFRNYIEAYLLSLDEINSQEMTFLVRELQPGPTGLPIEIYAFAGTVDWIRYERIQAEIVDHLLAAAGWFDLRLFQYQGLIGG